MPDPCQQAEPDEAASAARSGRDPTPAEEAGPSFEASLAELQRIVEDLESGAVGLEESLRRYEQGMALLRRCCQMLEQAEQRIEIVSGRGADGAPATVPFDAAATYREAAPAAGRRARSVRGEDPPDEPPETMF